MWIKNCPDEPICSALEEIIMTLCSPVGRTHLFLSYSASSFNPCNQSTFRTLAVLSKPDTLSHSYSFWLSCLLFILPRSIVSTSASKSHVLPLLGWLLVMPLQGKQNCHSVTSKQYLDHLGQIPSPAAETQHRNAEDPSLSPTTVGTCWQTKGTREP